SSGDDTLDGKAGSDRLSGGAGNDIFVVDDLGDRVVEATGQGSDLVRASVNFTLAANVENLTLLDRAITGTGNELANLIVGNGLDNLLDGGAGADTLNGGAGNDTYVVDNVGDVVIETSRAVNGIDTVRSSVDFALGGASVENLILTGAALKGSGNSLN